MHLPATLAAFCLAALLGAAPAGAADPVKADPVKIGFITTLSGPGGYLGEDIRDGFLLAVTQGGGKLGGVAVAVLAEDDALKPGNAKQIVDRDLRSEHVKIFTGVVFANVTEAILPDILDAGAYFLGPNTSPNDYNGKNCDPHYFVTGWDETLHSSAGVLANERGDKTLFVMAPNYVTGRQVVAAVKRNFTGRIVGELYTSLDQTDFSPEIAQIRAAHPDAIYEFEPGGLGIIFLKQFAASGLAAQIPLVVAAPSIDPHILAAVGDAAANMHVAAEWNSDFPNPDNQAFVAAFRAAYGRLPTYYAAHGYDTARLIGSALQASHGAVDDAFRLALKAAAFPSVRGYFHFASNQAPVLNWFELTVQKGENGSLGLHTLRQFRTHQGGAYADLCPMK